MIAIEEKTIKNLFCNYKIFTFVKISRHGHKRKLMERFKNRPKDFNWDELVRLFSVLEYKIDNKGKTSGSRVIFAKGESSYMTHKPHPGSIVKGYVMKQVLEFLTKNKLI